MPSLEGKSALVTGAAGGIGTGICGVLLRQGAAVVLTDQREEALRRAAESLHDEGRVLGAVAADVRETAAVGRLLDDAWALAGALDVLVNAAGIYPSAPILEMAEEDWDKVLDVNLKAPFLLSQAYVRRVVAAGREGVIVNVTSGAADRARPGAAHYCVSKAGLDMLTRCFAVELAARGVRANAVSPGFVEVGSEVSPLSPKYTEAIKRTIPAPREGSPEDIGRAVAFVASDEAGWVHGATLRVDGGSGAGNPALPLSSG